MTIQTIRLQRDIGSTKAGTRLRVDKVEVRKSPLKAGVDYQLLGTLPSPVEPDPIPVDAPLVTDQPAPAESN